VQPSLTIHQHQSSLRRCSYLGFTSPIFASAIKPSQREKPEIDERKEKRDKEMKRRVAAVQPKLLPLLPPRAHRCPCPMPSHEEQEKKMDRNEKMGTM
jgi:hypothetical protein